jgi:hypothetical protein
MKTISSVLMACALCLGANSAAKAASAQNLSPVLVVFQGGPIFENSYGGVGFALSLMAGGGGSYFTAGVRLNVGARWEDDDPKWEPGLEVGYRYMARLPSGLTPHFALTIGYNHLWQLDPQHDDITYDWHVPVVRIGGGLLWGFGSRFSIGFDVSYLGGFAFHANADENPWGETYDWQYNAGHIQYIMTF